MYDWLIGQKVYDGNSRNYHRFTITGIKDDSFTIKTYYGKVEKYSINGLFAHFKEGTIKLLPEPCENTVEKQISKIPTAQEAYKTTCDSGKNVDLHQIKVEIEAAVEAGEFQTAIPNTFTDAQQLFIKQELEKLGYIVVNVPSYVSESCLVISWRKYD